MPTPHHHTHYPRDAPAPRGSSRHNIIIAIPEKKYVAPLPGYDNNNTSSGSTPLWSKIVATKGEWTTVTKKMQTPAAAKEKVTPEQAIRNRNISYIADCLEFCFPNR